MTLEIASARLVGFADVLRGAGFAASTDQAISFLAATEALGPRSLDDIRRASVAIFGPPPERKPQFDALFEQHFLGRSQAVQVEEQSEETPQGEAEPLLDETGEASDPPGQTASLAAVHSARAFQPQTVEDALRRFAREAPILLPERKTRRMAKSRRGEAIDRLRTLRAAAKTDGEVSVLMRRKRRTTLRPILLLIDISGSMKGQTEDLLRFAHALTRLPTRVETFTLSTEFTRATQALRLRAEAQSLDRVAIVVEDFDGGTRLGETLSALLSVPRYAGFARGAIVVTLSDGLEIGAPDLLVTAARKLRQLSFAHLWLTPLADGPDFEPKTDALIRIAPYVDEFGSARSIPHICAHLLGAPMPVSEAA